MDLVPVRTVEEVDLALISMQIAWKTAEIRQLQRELSPLESVFAAFERRVANHSAAVRKERDRLLHLCSELERYTSRLHARLLADPTGELNAVFSLEELREIGDLFGVDVPDEWFGEELHATTSPSGWDWADNGTFSTSIPQPELPLVDQENLRALYRQLARTFHPDLCSNDQERHFRQEVMLRINHAWHDRDLAAMLEIRGDMSDLLEGRIRSATSYRIAWLRRELDRLESVSEQHRTRLLALRTSKTFPLWHDASLATAAVARHKSRLESEIVALRNRYEVDVREFQLALGAYAIRT